ncbi:MAG: DUF4159 domain-containing protein [Vicinamibacterales bacterium]
MKKILVCIALAAAGATVAALASDRSAAAPAQDSYLSGNIAYDGQPAFVRLRYATGFGGFGRRGRDPGWFHDYPTADIHLMKIIGDLTSVTPHVDGSNILSLDDPELLMHPIAYMSEPGFWAPTDGEALGLRAYLQKGGFIIFDDFRGNDWYNLEEQMTRVIPTGRFVEVDVSHPLFHSFFDIKSLEYLQSYNQSSSGRPTYWVLFEDNDPGKRVMAIANRDNDLGEYWEYSDTGTDPIDFSNEAYKFGVNYWLYGLTR